jgi:hypothetical protein
MFTTSVEMAYRSILLKELRGNLIVHQLDDRKETKYWKL